MSNVRYTLVDDPIPRLGLIALQVDETIEEDMRRAFAPQQARIHVTRVPSGAELTPDTIMAMESALPAAAALLPPAVHFDVVAYGCTSGTALIGASRVRELVQASTRTRAVTDPLTASVAAMRALGLTKIGIVSPYIDSVANPIRAAFENEGLVVPATLSFGEEVESRVARISPSSIYAASVELAAREKLDGIFLSCTNLRTLDVIPELEAELDLPMISSNQALAWHMASLSGINLEGPTRGCLFKTIT